MSKWKRMRGAECVAPARWRSLSIAIQLLAQGFQLPASEVGIDPRQNKVGPVFAKLAPEIAGFAPGQGIDPFAMLEVRLKNAARPPRHFRLRNAHQQFI